MAAVSASHTASALTPPSSSHGAPSSWNYSGQIQSQNPTSHIRSKEENEYTSSVDRRALSSQTNGSSIEHQTSRPNLSQYRADTFNSSHSSKTNIPTDGGYLAPARVSALGRKDSSISDSGSAPDSLLDLYGTNSANRSALNSMDLGDRTANGDGLGDDEDPDRSRWIHRDKLARIESQELQAAGIILPRSRAHSKSSRRERSRDQHGNGLGRSEESGQYQKRQRVGERSFDEVEDQRDTSWDLRTPEEAADDRYNAYRDYSNGQKGSSRIPLYKESPLPVPLDYIERDTPVQRTRSNGWDDEGISYPKSRSRSQSLKGGEELATTPTARRFASESSPTKKTTTPAVRKGSIPSARVAGATPTNPAVARPKTRSGQKDTANPRPTTRSGELGPSNSVKQPEGDPPWLASMYKPDPRLPPDQQILPTVARRLQQEKWEKEGKFGNAYDREFRPINDEELPYQPEIVPQVVETSEKRPEEQEEWPLRTPRSPTLSTGRPGTAGGYSTVPKIQDMPKSPLAPKPQHISEPIRMQELPEEEEVKKKGCGCCIVM